jgi:hypothetical protein
VKHLPLRATWIFGTILAISLVPIPAAAHCDTLDGPVVAAARLALKTGDVTPILKWVKPENEPEIRAAFARTLKVRALSPEARDLADNFFFETLVRIHRAGEGAPFTGLKPAGQVEPGIALADKALATGSADELLKTLSAELAAGIRRRFQEVREAAVHANDSVAAGREYVRAYVEFIHYVEGFHELSSRTHAETTRQASAHPE